MSGLTRGEIISKFKVRESGTVVSDKCPRCHGGGFVFAVNDIVEIKTY